jgi:hypothetical protein
MQTMKIKVIKAANRNTAAAEQTVQVPTQAQAAREMAGNVTGWVREARQAREARNPKAEFAALFAN